MHTLLIIGGSGFFGKSILDAFVRGLLAPWHIGHIIVLARSASQLSTTHPHLVASDVTLINDDITTTDTLPRAEYVIHAAASTDARNYLNAPAQEQQNIQAGTNNYCRLAPVFHRHSRIVYTSSGAVYGQQPAEIAQLLEDYQPTTLEALGITKQSYALAKQHAEQAIKAIGAQGLNVSIARCFAFVGYYLPLDQHFAVGNFIGDVLNNRPLQVKATHPVYRSYMYADDLVVWLMTIAQHANANCPVYNVGSDEAVLLHDLAQTMAHEYGAKTDIASISASQVDRYVPSIIYAKQSLGLTITWPIKEAIEATIKHLKANIKSTTV